MKNTNYLKQNTSRKNIIKFQIENFEDTFSFWIDYYLHMVIYGVRSEEVSKKITLHLNRFKIFFEDIYGYDKIAICVKRDILSWRTMLEGQGLAAATINNHIASLSGFTTWVSIQSPDAFPVGDPCKGISELTLPPLEPRTLNIEQISSLKNVCDRLERLHQLKGRKWSKNSEIPKHSLRRPFRDRAIVFVLLSTGLRREELVKLNLEQISPNVPEELYNARKAKIINIQGKGKTKRTVFLSSDARIALAEYISKERINDINENSIALFLSAINIPQRSHDGRMSPRSINLILKQIGQWHDAEIKDSERKISPLRPHDLRHTFAFQLASVTNADSYELERRLGHRSQRYIQRYTNPPEDIAAKYVEKL